MTTAPPRLLCTSSFPNANNANLISSCCPLPSGLPWHCRPFGWAHSKRTELMDINYDDVSSPEYELNYDDVSEPEYDAGVSDRSAAARARQQLSRGPTAAGVLEVAGAAGSPNALDHPGQVQGSANLPALLTVQQLVTPELCDSRPRGGGSPVDDHLLADAATAGAGRRPSRSLSPAVSIQQQQRQQQQDWPGSSRRSCHNRSVSPAGDDDRRYIRGESWQHRANSICSRRQQERTRGSSRPRSRSRSRSRYRSRGDRRCSPDYTAGCRPSYAMPNQEGPGRGVARPQGSSSSSRRAV